MKYAINKYQALVYTQALYLYSSAQEKTPQCFSKVFGKRKESDHQRFITDYNWKSSIAGNQLPSQATVERAHLICPKATKYYESPLWKALRTPHQSDTFWQTLFGNLQPKIYRIISKQRLTGEQTIKQPSFFIPNYRVFNIFRFIDDQSLAVLIALVRLEREAVRPNPEFCEFVEYLITINLGVLLSEQPYDEYRYELFSFIRDHIFKPSENKLAREKRWALSKSELDQTDKQLKSCLKRARELHIIKSKKDIADFLYYFGHSEQFIVRWELASGRFIYSPKISDEKYGIAWIIQRINEGRSSSEQIKPLLQASNTGSDEQSKTANPFNFNGVTK